MTLRALIFNKPPYHSPDVTHLNLLGEGGTEHHSSPLPSRWHSVLLDYTTDLGLKTHVQHSVSFIQDQEPGKQTTKFDLTFADFRNRDLE